MTFLWSLLQVIKDELYVAEFNSTWYRVQVQYINRNNNTCDVQLIDEGYDVELPLNSVFALNAQFVDEPYDRRYSTQFSTPLKCKLFSLSI